MKKLTKNELKILNLLKKGELNVTQISKKLGMLYSSLLPIIQRLEYRDAYIISRVETKNGFRRIVTLTEKGKMI